MTDLKKKFFAFFKSFWPIFLITFIVLGFFWKVIFKGATPMPGDFPLGIYFPWLDYKWGFAVGVPVKNPIMADVPSFIYPMQMTAINIFKSGRLPLWNPYILAGTPLLANFQSAPFSITNVFYFIFKQIDAWSMQIIFQHLFAAVFIFILLRYWKVSKLGSVLGGIIYAFSGFNVIWSQWNGHALSASFIPLILYFEDRFLKERKYLFGFLISIVLALQIYSGYPQVVIYTSLAMGLLFLVRCISFKYIFPLFVFCLLGIGLSAPQWLPGAELLKNSQRAVEYHPFEWAFLPWQKTITFIASDFFGNHATKNYWGPQDYTSNTGYVGVAAIVLSLVSLSLFKKSKEVFYSIVLVLVALLLAYPTPISIFLWKSGFLGFNAASAHRSLVLFNFGIAALAAFGFDFLNRETKLKQKVVAILLPLITIIGFGIYAYSLRSKTVYGNSILPIALRNLVIPSFILFFSGILLFLKGKLKFLFLFLSVFELFYFGWKFTPFFSKHLIFPTTPVLDYLMKQEKPFRVTGNDVIPMNMRMNYGLESPEGYDALYSEETAKLLSSINQASGSAEFTGRYGFIDREDSNILDLLNTKYFLALKLNEKGSPDKNGKNLLPLYSNPKFKKVFEDGSVAILENKNALNRAFMVFDWEVVSDDKTELNKLLDSSFPLSTKIILSEVPNIEKDGEDLNNKVTYLKYREDESLIEVETKKKGFLFVSDTFFPGWHAYLDGKEIKIFRADFAFRAVEVPEGIHKITFLYKPKSFFNGVIIGISSTIVLISGMIYFSLKKIKK